MHLASLARKTGKSRRVTISYDAYTLISHAWPLVSQLALCGPSCRHSDLHGAAIDILARHAHKITPVEDRKAVKVIIKELPELDSNILVLQAPLEHYMGTMTHRNTQGQVHRLQVWQVCQPVSVIIQVLWRSQTPIFCICVLGSFQAAVLQAGTAPRLPVT